MRFMDPAGDSEIAEAFRHAGVKSQIRIPKSQMGLLTPPSAGR
jgi:hypothetical protein